MDKDTKDLQRELEEMLEGEGINIKPAEAQSIPPEENITPDKLPTAQGQEPVNFDIPANFVPVEDIMSRLGKSLDDLQKEGLNHFDFEGKTGQFYFRRKDIANYELKHPQEDELMPLERAAAYIGVGKDWLIQRTNAGSVKFYKKGGEPCFRKEDLEKLDVTTKSTTETALPVPKKPEHSVSTQPPPAPDSPPNEEEEQELNSVEATLKEILGLKDPEYQTLIQRGLVDLILTSNAFKTAIDRASKSEIGYSPEALAEVRKIAEAAAVNFGRLDSTVDSLTGRVYGTIDERLELAVSGAYEETEATVKQIKEAGENVKGIFKTDLDSTRKEFEFTKKRLRTLAGQIRGDMTTISGELAQKIRETENAAGNAERSAQQAERTKQEVLNIEDRISHTERRRNGRMAELFSRHPKKTLFLTGSAVLLSASTFMAGLGYCAEKVKDLFNPTRQTQVANPRYVQARTTQPNITEKTLMEKLAMLGFKKHAQGRDIDVITIERPELKQYLESMRMKEGVYGQLPQNLDSLRIKGGYGFDNPTSVKDDATVWRVDKNGTKEPVSGFLDIKGGRIQTILGTRFKDAAYAQD